MKLKITFFILFFVGIYNSFSTEYYVDPMNGNDGNNGISINTAFRSLSAVSSLNLNPGDTVFLREGTYTNPGQVLLVIEESGNEDNWITIQNYRNEKPVLEFDSWTGIDMINGASYIKIKGLTIKGARTKITLEEALLQPGSCENNLEGDPNPLYNGTGILAVGPNLVWSNPDTTDDEIPPHIWIEDCEIFDCTSSGMAFQQADYITIINNKIHHNAWYTLFGTSAVNLYQFINSDDTEGIHNVVSNNLLYANQMKVPQIPSCEFFDGNALIVDDFNHTQIRNYRDISNRFEAYSAQTLIKNNISVENGGSGLHFFLSSNCLIYNNTVVNNAFQNNGDNGNAQLRIGVCNDFEIKNNIFVGEKLNSVSGNENIIYSHNYNEGTPLAAKFRDCTTCPSQNIQFSNTDINDNFPYITDLEGIVRDAGILISEVSDDFLFGSRPDGGNADIGAYELRDCFPTIWYVDNDDDGIGSDTESIESCEQPIGFVATSGDLCDEDPLKNDPGDCGCGIPEDTCDTTCASPEFDPNQTYSTSGTIILFEGRAYENLWHTVGNQPDDGGPWRFIKVCDSDAFSDCSSIPEWTSATPYPQAGTQVVYLNVVYTNLWYAEGGNIPGEHQVWKLTGACAPELTNKGSFSLVSTTNKLIDFDKSIEFYPTSVENDITLKILEEGTITIYGIEGRFMTQQKLVSGVNTIEVSSLQNGMYLAIIESENQVFTEKFVKN